MSLSHENKLGPYEIMAPLGAGGTGEVYHARDTLHRELLQQDWFRHSSAHLT